MDLERQEIRLKSGLHRSVSLRAGSGGERRVAKLFRSRGWWRRVMDRSRARREFEMLQALHAEGLAVPKPLALQRVPEGWELLTAWVPEARNLLELTQPGAAPPRAPERIARRLGALVGQAHALGLEHGDLHPGNLLLDGEGELWLIDLGGARRSASISEQVVERDLTGLNGDLRESCARGLRQRFWIAWMRSFESHGGRLTQGLKRLAVRAEARAATRRREVLMQHGDRWLRPSGLCESRMLGSARVLLARHGLAQAWAASGDWQQALSQGANELCGPLQLNQDHELWIDARAPHVERNWLSAGRGWQHKLSSATPIFLQRGPRPRAGYALPRGACALPSAAALGPELARALRTRGLSLGAGQAWCTPEGRQLLGPGCHLTSLTEHPHG